MSHTVYQSIAAGTRAVDAGRIMLWAEVRGSTQTSYADHVVVSVYKTVQSPSVCPRGSKGQQQSRIAAGDAHRRLHMKSVNFGPTAMQSNTLVIVITAVVYITDSDSQCHQPTQTFADSQSTFLQARWHSFSLSNSQSHWKKENWMEDLTTEQKATSTERQHNCYDYSW